ncbi:MAG: hypothetical protein ACLR7Z_10445 [Bilophila wadsworthia]
MDEEAKKAMDACGLDAEDPENPAPLPGVKYGEDWSAIGRTQEARPRA